MIPAIILDPPRNSKMELDAVEGITWRSILCVVLHVKLPLGHAITEPEYQQRPV